MFMIENMVFSKPMYCEDEERKCMSKYFATSKDHKMLLLIKDSSAS